MGQGLKHVGGNIRKSISGISGSVITKSKELTHFKKNKFASADNISNTSKSCESCSVDEETTYYDTEQRDSGVCSTTPSVHASSSTSPFKSEPCSENSSASSENLPFDQPNTPLQISCLEPIFSELQKTREDVDKMQEELETIKQSILQEISAAGQTLLEHRTFTERLEEHVVDLSRLHHFEFQHLKQTITDMEDKLQYQREERLNDIREMLESCQNKISKMEILQQQYVTIEGIDNSNARVLVAKSINVVLTVLQLILLLLATASGIAMPFLSTKLQFLTTFILVSCIVLVLQYWPEVKEFIFDLLPPIKETSILRRNYSA